MSLTGQVTRARRFLANVSGTECGGTCAGTHLVDVFDHGLLIGVLHVDVVRHARPEEPRVLGDGRACGCVDARIAFRVQKRRENAIGSLAGKMGGRARGRRMLSWSPGAKILPDLRVGPHDGCSTPREALRQAFPIEPPVRFCFSGEKMRGSGGSRFSITSGSSDHPSLAGSDCSGMTANCALSLPHMPAVFETILPGRTRASGCGASRLTWSPRTDRNLPWLCTGRILIGPRHSKRTSPQRWPELAVPGFIFWRAPLVSHRSRRRCSRSRAGLATKPPIKVKLRRARRSRAGSPVTILPLRKHSGPKFCLANTPMAHTPGYPSSFEAST